MSGRVIHYICRWPEKNKNISTTHPAADIFCLWTATQSQSIICADEKVFVGIILSSNCVKNRMRETLSRWLFPAGVATRLR